MSRSYKKTPAGGDTTNKFMKKYANRRLRRRKSEELFQHNAYKKYNQSWDIKDYWEGYVSYTEHCHRIWRNYFVWAWKYEDPPTEEYLRKTYNRWYRRK